MNFVSRPSYCKISSPSIYIYIYTHTHTSIHFIRGFKLEKIYIYTSSVWICFFFFFFFLFHFFLFKVPSSIHFLRPSFIRGFKFEKIYIHTLAHPSSRVSRNIVSKQLSSSIVIQRIPKSPIRPFIIVFLEEKFLEIILFKLLDHEAL